MFKKYSILCFDWWESTSSFPQRKEDEEEKTKEIAIEKRRWVAPVLTTILIICLNWDGCFLYTGAGIACTVLLLLPQAGSSAWTITREKKKDFGTILV